jgi:hypothetical protein
MARRWIEMFADWLARVFVTLALRLVAPRLAHGTLALAGWMAPSESEVAGDIADLLTARLEQTEALQVVEVDQRASEEGVEFRLPLRWSLQLCARAMQARVAATGAIANATMGLVTYSFVGAWAALWFLFNVCVPMKTDSGFTAAAWVYSVPQLGLLAFALVLTCAAFWAFAGLKWDRRRWWRITGPSHDSTRKVMTASLRLAGAVLAVSALGAILECPSSLAGYLILGVVALALSSEALGVRLAVVSAGVGAVGGAGTLLLLWAHLDALAWLATALLVAPILRITVIRSRETSLRRAELPTRASA